MVFYLSIINIIIRLLLLVAPVPCMGDLHLKKQSNLKHSGLIRSIWGVNNYSFDLLFILYTLNLQNTGETFEDKLMQSICSKFVTLC